MMGGGGEHLWCVSEREAFNVAFPNMGQVRKTYSSTIDAEEEHVTGKSLWYGVWQVGITHSTQFFLRKQLALLFGWQGLLYATQQRQMWGKGFFLRFFVEGMNWYK